MKSGLEEGGDNFIKKMMLGQERASSCLPTLQRLSLGLEYRTEVMGPECYPFPVLDNLFSIVADNAIFKQTNKGIPGQSQQRGTDSVHQTLRL